MKKVLLVICLFVFLNTSAQFVDKSTDSRFGVISPEIEARVKSYTEFEILWYRAKLCPQVDFEQFVSRGYANNIVISKYNPKEVFFKTYFPEIKSSKNYEMILEVVRWPERNPKLNSYLIKKQGLRFTNGIDTVSFNLCNDYFKHDERFLVYFEENSSPLMISGNVFKDVSYPFVYPNKKIRALGARELVYYELAQYNTSQPILFPHKSFETEAYFQFKINESLLSPRAIIVRVPKLNPHNELEVMYYTNDTLITKGDIKNLYEVKYNFYSKSESYKQNLPVISKINYEILNNKMRNEGMGWREVYHQIMLPFNVIQEEVNIVGKIDSVFFHPREPYIIVVDNTGTKTEIFKEEDVRYLIIGKGKRRVIVTEKSKIIYEDD